MISIRISASTCTSSRSPHPVPSTRSPSGSFVNAVSAPGRRRAACSCCSMRRHGKRGSKSATRWRAASRTCTWVASRATSSRPTSRTRVPAWRPWTCCITCATRRTWRPPSATSRSARPIARGPPMPTTSASSQAEPVRKPRWRTYRWMPTSSARSRRNGARATRRRRTWSSRSPPSCAPPRTSPAIRRCRSSPRARAGCARNTRSRVSRS